MSDYSNLINSFDVKELKKQTEEEYKPFPFFYVDNFLNKDFANEVYDSFPGYDDAVRIGKTFSAVNEIKKVQVTDPNLFPAPIKKLNELLASKEFVEKLETILGIENLIADPGLVGGGIHETREGGRLDVHVDFNYNKELNLYRRVNILLYFNKGWNKEYGGILDLWDKDVKKCYAEIEPIFNRLACFATSEISFHGVTPVKCPENMSRKSFAAYYYTSEPHKDFDGKFHTTIFKARPNEWKQAYLNMPAEKIKRNSLGLYRSFKNKIKSIINT